MKEVNSSQKQTKMVTVSPDFILAHLLMDLTKKASESSTQTSLSGSLEVPFLTQQLDVTAD